MMVEEKRRPGRPKLADEYKRNKQLLLKLRKTELKKIQDRYELERKKSDTMVVSLTDFIIKSASGELRKESGLI